MTEMTDPLIALRSMSKIMMSGVEPPRFEECRINKGYFLHVDKPNGKIRFSYFLKEGRLIKAVSIFAQAEPYDGSPCFAVGYAVMPQYRKAGIGTAILRVGVDELFNGLRKIASSGYYLEAVIDPGNIASRKVVEKVFGNIGKDCIDSVSGRPAIGYIKYISAQQVDSAEASTIAVPPSGPSGSPR